MFATQLNHPPIDAFDSTLYVAGTQPFSFKFAASSSTSRQFDHHAPPNKRKHDRACDQCRRRKTKCDGMRSPTHICTHCIQSRKECTYLESSKPRGPPKAYVTGLEDRMELLETLLRKLRPGVDFSAELSPPVIRDSWKYDTPDIRYTRLQPTQIRAEHSRGYSQSRDPRPLSPYNSPQGLAQENFKKLEHSRSMEFKKTQTRGNLGLPSTLDHARSFLKAMSMNLEPPESSARIRARTQEEYYSDSSDSTDSDIGVMSPEGDVVPLALEAFESMADGLEYNDQRRYHGKSSVMRSVFITKEAKQQHYLRQRGNFSQDDVMGMQAGRKIRPEYWETPRWEIDWEGDTGTSLLAHVLNSFPPPDLAETLLSLYFRHSNSFYPLLHRPTFLRQWADGLHRRDIWFAAVCMGIFAVASRFCDDPRVLADNIPGQESAAREEHKAGWVYIRACFAIHRARSTAIRQTCLFEVQTTVLVVIYLRGCQFGAVSWYFTGVGLRKVQDLGVHQAKVYAGVRPTVQRELWKRSVWLLVAFDRVGSVCLGRACCIGEDEYDLPFPLEVDDEYWQNDEDADLIFRQPEGKRSLITGFNLYLKLTQMFAVVIRTLYATDKSRVFHDIKKETVIKNVNRVMKEWMDTVPAHLRWSPTMKDPVFADQATTLLATYNLLQILLYSPFTSLPTSSKKPLNPSEERNQEQEREQHDAFRPFAICVDAARSCARIIDRQVQRGLFNAPSLIQSSNACAALLLAHVWDLKSKQKAGAVSGAPEPSLQPTIDELMADVAVLVGAMEIAAVKWEIAAHLLKDLRISLPDLNDGFPDDVDALAHSYAGARSASGSGMQHDAWALGISSNEESPALDEVSQLVATAPTHNLSQQPDLWPQTNRVDEWTRSAGRAEMYCPPSFVELAYPAYPDSRADPRALTHPEIMQASMSGRNEQRWDGSACRGWLNLSDSPQFQAFYNEPFCGALYEGNYSGGYV